MRNYYRSEFSHGLLYESAHEVYPELGYTSAALPSPSPLADPAVLPLPVEPCHDSHVIRGVTQSRRQLSCQNCR